MEAKGSRDLRSVFAVALAQHGILILPNCFMMLVPPLCLEWISYRSSPNFVSWRQQRQHQQQYGPMACWQLRNNQ